MRRTYENAKIKVNWDSDKCIHVGYCTGGLPQVFNITHRPWVDIEGADAEEISRVVDTCPTGALSSEIPGAPEPGVTVKIFKDGPARVTGNCRLLNSEGEEIESGKAFALCRCGASQNMPFCDGSHQVTGFKG